MALVVYDADGKMISLDAKDDKTIENGYYFDYEFNTVVPSVADGAEIKIMVWENMTSMEPLIPAKVYTVETNDFAVPNVMTDNMVLAKIDGAQLPLAPFDTIFVFTNLK